MGVYVRGVEMPESCGECNCELAQIIQCKYWTGRESDGCPLVGIEEPHGRLIDADEIIKTARRIALMPWGDDREIWIKFTFTLAEVERLIEKSPIVIEAEKE